MSVIVKHTSGNDPDYYHMEGKVPHLPLLCMGRARWPRPLESELESAICIDSHIINSVGYTPISFGSACDAIG